MFKSAKNLEIKSFLVYLFPFLGIFCGAAAVLGLKDKRFILAASAASGAVSIVGLYNLYTTNLSALIVSIKIGKGLWLSMYAFLIIFLASTTWLVTDRT